MIDKYKATTIQDLELDAEYILEHIDEAISKEWLKVFYQPIVRIRTHEISDCEALCRWRDPTFGMLSPSLFIPILEENDLIYKLDMFMIDRVLMDIKGLREQGIRTVPISVNLSRQDFEINGESIFDYIEKEIKKYGLKRRDLDIEITESIINSDDTLFRTEMKQFYAAGYSLWMDDFGSGFSSFNVLKNYHFDVLKIDMVFLKDIDDPGASDNTKNILYSIIKMAKRLGMETVCEGTETKARVELMRELGCEKAQGFHFCKPCQLSKLLNMNMKWESSDAREYEEKISLISVIDAPTPTKKKETIIHRPMAIVEYRNGRFSALQFNASFKEFFYSGMEEKDSDYDNESGEENIMFSFDNWVNGESVFAKHFLEANKRCAISDKRQSLDFVLNGEFGTIDFDFIAQRTDKNIFAVLMTVDSMKGRGGLNSISVRQAALRNMYSIYHFVHLLNPESETAELIFSSNAEYSLATDEMPMDEAVPRFAKLYIHPDDRERFIKNYSKESLTELYKSKAGDKVNWYRTIHDGKYIWMIYTTLTFEFLDKWYVLSLARDLVEAGMPEQGEINQDGIFIPLGSSDVPDDIYGKHPDSIVKELLRGSDRLQNIVNMMDVGIFWKDNKRRFLGVNKYFLDYYGFSSVIDVIGKNDEEVGWHIHPEGFRSDEEDVLNSGISIRGAIGTCLKKGEVRTIMAYKRPVIVDGKIEGLLGYFFDITDAENNVSGYNYTDAIPNMKGHNGFYEVLDLYVKEYEKTGIDFVEISVELDGFDEYMNLNGVASGGKTLLALLEGLQNIAGVDSVIRHMGNGEIRILHQIKSESDATLLRQKIGTGVASILGNDVRAIVHWFMFSEMTPDEINELYGIKK